ncbi:CLUMA_CG008041, isoform A [Clunio marinus]|uniref:CLUMA_CG008041, isoform A n=2 Tax=Clunio marinus TaxID=568069 RepID=A0A1J1I457_9DIPT|nr:CLUMA_CG008041, isoform A [Clunio marinus]
MVMVTELHHQESGAPINGGTIQRNIDSGLSKSCHYSNDSSVLMLRSDSMSPTMMSEMGDEHYSKDSSPNSPTPYDGSVKRKDIFSQRKQREFIPDAKKDDSYWDRRRRNNEAAKRSREKRRFNDMVLEQRVIELTKENHVLKAQLDAIKDKYNISGENLVSVDQIMATLPTSEQVLSLTKRLKTSPSHGSNGNIRYDTPSLNGNSPPKQSLTPANYVVTPREQLHPVEHSQQIHQQMQQPQPHMIYRQNQESPFEGHHHVDDRNESYGPSANVPIIRVSPNPPHHQVPSTPVITSLFKPLHPTPVQSHQRQPSPQQHHQPHDLHKFILLNKNGESLTSEKDKKPSNGANVISVEKMVIDDEPTGMIATSKPPSGFQHHIQLTKFLTSKANYMPHHSYGHHAHHNELETSSVLNLSRRTCSTGSGSDIGNDHEVEHFGTNEYYNDYANHGGGSNGNQSDRSSTVDEDHELEHTSNASAGSNISNDHNNSLPLKLRHKTHFIGDKESAATALLALHNIKQEPNGTSSSPVWDGENSSDERDSGISIGHTNVNGTDWSNIQRKIIINANTASAETFEPFNTNLTGLLVADQRVATERGDIHLKSHLARLESEIHTIKNMMILNTNGSSAPINA